MSKDKTLGEAFAEARLAFEEVAEVYKSLPLYTRFRVLVEGFIKGISEWLKELNGKESEKDN